MKKLLGIMVSVVIVLSLGACGAKEENNTQNQNSNEETKQSSMAMEKQENTNEPDGESPIYSIKIDGEEYIFPMTYEEFKAYGWTYHNPEDDDVSQWGTVLRPNSNMLVDYDKGEIKWLQFNFFNDTDEEASLEECKINGFRLEYDRTVMGEDADRYINIPKGSIVFNDTVIIGESDRKTLAECFGIDILPDNEIGMISTDDMVMTFGFDENGIFNEVLYDNRTVMK